MVEAPSNLVNVKSFELKILLLLIKDDPLP